MIPLGVSVSHSIHLKVRCTADAEIVTRLAFIVHRIETIDGRTSEGRWCRCSLSCGRRCRFCRSKCTRSLVLGYAQLPNRGSWMNLATIGERSFNETMMKLKRGRTSRLIGHRRSVKFDRFPRWSNHRGIRHRGSIEISRAIHDPISRKVKDEWIRIALELTSTRGAALRCQRIEYRSSGAGLLQPMRFYFWK